MRSESQIKFEFSCPNCSMPGAFYWKIESTATTDGACYRDRKPEILTRSCRVCRCEMTLEFVRHFSMTGKPTKAIMDLAEWDEIQTRHEQYEADIKTLNDEVLLLRKWKAVAN